MKKLVKWISILCMIIMCTGCSDNAPLTYEQMLEDYDYLWTSIQENYALMNVAERKTSKNFLTIKDSYRNKITESTTTLQFDAYLNLFLGEFDGVGQMEKLDDVSYKRLYQKLEVSSGLSNSLNYLFDVIDNGKSKSYYHFKETKISDETAEKNIITRIIEKDNIAYIKMGDMDYSSMKEDGKILSKFYKEIKDFSACIIDLRGVKNGVQQYWKENIVSPNIDASKSYTTLSLVKGAMAKEYVSSEYPLSEIRKLEALPALQLKDIEGMTDFTKVTHKIKPSRKKPMFHGNFYLITDENVRNTGEQFAMFCKQTGFATILGTYTGGGSSLDPLLIKLPNSGIIVRMMIDNSLNPDGASTEEYGTTPDIRIESNDVLDVVLKQIHQFHPTPVTNEIVEENILN